jgi:hypothetical protein
VAALVDASWRYARQNLYFLGGEYAQRVPLHIFS